MRLYEKMFGRILRNEEGSEGASGGSDYDPGSNGDAGNADSSAGDAGGANPPAQDWPDDWRAKISTDEKHAKTLSRFASPKAVYESYTALRQKLDSGEVKASVPFPEKGTDEDKANWRKANGIPENPKEYLSMFKSGLVIGEDDDTARNFIEHAHSLNLRPEHVEGILGWYQQLGDQAEHQQQESDMEYLRASEDSLRSEWGGEYRRNVNMIKGLLETMPQDIQPLFVGARLADGRALINTPEVARWLLETALTVNPVGAFVPGAGANMASAIEDEISSIEKVMREDRKRYNGDTKMQERLRELYGARERVKK